MKIFFRVDANKEIGSGHIIRCSNLALVLKEMGIDCIFIVNKNRFSHFDHLPQLNYEFISANTLEEDATETTAIISKESLPYLVLDSYLHDSHWEKIQRRYVTKLLVWDDLANRKHSCDILVDCGFQRSESDYKELVDSETVFLIGAKYCPISFELRNLKGIKQDSKKIHLFFGSLDSGNIALEYYREIIKVLPEYSINIAISNMPNSSILKIWENIKRNNDELFIGKSIGESLQGCQWAIGAPGVTTWERAFLGIFGFYIAINSNQVSIVQALENMGVCKYIGNVEDSLSSNIQKIHESIENVDIQKASKKCRDLVDGLGLERIAKEVLR